MGHIIFCSTILYKHIIIDNTYNYQFFSAINKKYYKKFIFKISNSNYCLQRKIFIFAQFCSIAILDRKIITNNQQRHPSKRYFTLRKNLRLFEPFTEKR